FLGQISEGLTGGTSAKGVAQDHGVPRVRKDEAQEELEGRALPRAVRAEASEDGASRHLQGQVAQRRAALPSQMSDAIGLGESADVQRGRGFRHGSILGQRYEIGTAAMSMLARAGMRSAWFARSMPTPLFASNNL